MACLNGSPQHSDQFAALEPAVVTQMAMECQDYCASTWNFAAISELRL